ncbi:hypothetical protein F511_25222, partial [Dorcoceras hygrometricum]
EIWEKLTQICEGSEETKENKLIVALQKFELIKMKSKDTMAEFDERFSSLVIELARLNKTYSNRELALKVMRALPKEWDVKTMAMRELKDLNKMELNYLFANIKAYEFELETRAEAEPSTYRLVGPRRIRITPPGEAAEEQKQCRETINTIKQTQIYDIHRAFRIATLLATRAWLRPVSRGNRHFTVDCGRLRQSGPRPETGFLRQPALEGLTRSTRTDSPRQDWPEQFPASCGGGAA